MQLRCAEQNLGHASPGLGAQPSRTRCGAAGADVPRAALRSGCQLSPDSAGAGELRPPVH